MLGAIIGDIVGSVYEFNNTRDYHFPLFSSESDYTDDSILTAAVADWAMTDDDLTAELLVQKLVEYGTAYPSPLGGYGERFDMWLFAPQLLLDYRTGKPAGKRCPYHSWGNGSAMRVSALGWLYGSLEDTEEAAARSAAVTHDHPEGIKGAQAVAVAVYLASRGSSKAEIKQVMTERYHYDLSASWESLHQTYTWDSSCQGTVPQALICFLESTDFEDAIRKSVAIGGDSDTIGCITGGIAEAFYQEIPSFMVKEVDRLLPPHLKNILWKLGRTVEYAKCYDQYISPFLCRYECTPEPIGTLKSNEILVFGSDKEGRHQRGLSQLARDRFGAQQGVSDGPTGQSYAILMRADDDEKTYSSILDFLNYATTHPHLKFYVGPLHQDFDGFTAQEVAMMMRNARHIDNIVLPREYYAVLDK